MTTKQEAFKLKNQSLRLYLQGKGREAILKETGIAIDTFQRWKKEGEWEQLYSQNQTKIRQDLNIDIAEEKERSLKIIKAIESKYVQELQNNTNVPKSTTMYAQIQKVKWDILTPRTISQYNFMKQENTINEPTYTLEIIKPDDNTDIIEAKQEAA